MKHSMKITIQHDDGKEEIFQDVLDAYLAVNQRHPIMNKKKEIGFEFLVKSYSWGTNVRDLVKEIQQSLVELQEYLKNLPKK